MTGAAAFDRDARELTATYKAAVAAAIPDNICPTAAFWHELAIVIEGYLILAEKRAQRPPKRELERWRNITALVDELGEELRKVRRDQLWSDRSGRALSALYPVKDLAEAHAAAYETLAGEPFRGRQNAHREFLYGAVCDLWRRSLGLELHPSRSGVSGGPSVRFLSAVVGPVLGDKTPGVHGIAAIIRRERARRRRHTTSNSRK